MAVGTKAAAEMKAAANADRHLLRKFLMLFIGNTSCYSQFFPFYTLILFRADVKQITENLQLAAGILCFDYIIADKNRFFGDFLYC
jgi:hypothetical protein